MSETHSWLYNEQKAAKRLKVATVTMQCDPEPDLNRAQMVTAVKEIKAIHPDVKLVMFGEMVLGWYTPGMREYNHRVAEPIPGETTSILMGLAAEQDIFICFGLLESRACGMHNAQVLINPQGEIQAIHRKWNLRSQERGAGFQPGPRPVTVTDILGVKTGIVICADAASPRAMWGLMKSRLDLILLSLADDHDKGLFMAYFNARMYDAWIVTANRYGDENGYFWNGHTVISDPLGALKATSQDKAGYLVHELCFDVRQPMMKRILRNLIVKTPLLFHLLRNWNRIKEYR
jgi:predicted amidohydrolase